jgi:carboxylate-amine ligase
MKSCTPSFTFGIEEEYHLVDLDSRNVAARSPELMRDLERVLGDQVAPEFMQSQIEVATGICRCFTTARADLARMRTTVGQVAATHGLAPIASATHPFARLDRSEPSDKERYRVMAEDLAGASRRLVVCGMHVHVGIEDDETRIDLMNQARYFLPHLLALSTSSPFWQGEDTGLKGYRLAAYNTIPRTGLPGRFESWHEYQRTVDVLVQGGVIEDASHIWWDIRPSARFPTLELRAPDVCTRLDDAIAVAALYVSIVRMLWRLRRSNQRWRTYPVFLLAENRWRAQRYGVQGTLFDFGKGALVSISELIDELIAITAEDAAELGCTTHVARVRDIARTGTSADRQLEVFEREVGAGAKPSAALRAVVDHLRVETLAV